MSNDTIEAIPPVAAPLSQRRLSASPEELDGKTEKKSDLGVEAPAMRAQPASPKNEDGPPATATGPPEPASMKEVAQAISERLAEVQERGYLRELRFDYQHVGEGVFQLKVLDARTDKVLRTIPSEEQLEFSRKLERFLGLLIDEQV